MEIPILTFDDKKSSLSENRKRIVKEIVEVLALAEKKEVLTTKAAKEVFAESQDKALKKAQNLFNSLKESYLNETAVVTASETGQTGQRSIQGIQGEPTNIDTPSA